MKNLKYCLIKSINKNAPLVVIPSFENNGQEIFNKTRKITKEEFSLLLVYNLNWNDDLSPYFAKSIFDNAPDFKGEADNFLNYLTNTLISKVCNENEINPSYFMLVGYSMSGLFSIYSLYKTNYFKKIGSVSGSLWYPGFLDFINKSKTVKNVSTLYMSLGDKEKHTKNIYMKKVEENTLEIFELIKQEFINAKFEFNTGNHFQDESLRIAKCIKYLLEN